MHHTPTHPHAQTAIMLAAFNGQHRAHINRELSMSGCPRSLYTLASLLRTARIADEINAAPLKPTRFVYDPNFLGPGLAGLRQVHGEAA